jgi:hypothetical protein
MEGLEYVEPPIQDKQRPAEGGDQSIPGLGMLGALMGGMMSSTESEASQDAAAAVEVDSKEKGEER